MKILLTGGSGHLGKEFLRIFKIREYDKDGVVIHAPSSEELDITQPIKLDTDYDFIIHAAAYKDVVKAETERGDCFLTNVFGTYNLAKAFPHSKFVYISSNYAKNPTNFYAESKAMAELVVEKTCSNYLIVRTAFKPTPFPHEKAFMDQFTICDYVDVIAPMILEAIQKSEKYANKTIEVGTYRKTMYELALRTKPDVIPCSVNDVKGVKIQTEL